MAIFHLRRALTAALFGLGLVGGFSLPSTAQAEQPTNPAPRAGKVQVVVHVIHATEEGNKVDPKLQSLVRYLKPLRYTNYDLLSTHELPLGAKAPANFSIAGDRKVLVDLLERDDKRVRLRVQVVGAKGQKLLDTTLSVPRNGTFIVAGPKYGKGVLVLPLTAKY